MEDVRGRLPDTPRVDAPPAEASTAPPSWDSQKLLVGQRHVEVNAPPHTTFQVLRDCFNSKLAAEVDEDAWELHITAFLDYEAVCLKVAVYRNPNSETRTDIIFHDGVRDDVVRFGHVCSIAIDHLSTSNLQVLEPEGARSFVPVLVDGEFYDDPFEFEEDLPGMFTSMLRAADSPDASLRKQGLQALARWAEQRQDCIPAVADALFKHSELVGRLLQAPLAECYPLAVTLRIASCCPRNAERLAGRLLPLIPRAGLPSLVARELEETFGNLTFATVASRRFGKLADRLEKPAKFVGHRFGLSNASTCGSTTPSTYEPSELEEGLTVDPIWEDEDP